jgi:PD-(D/E)XK nuclease superfamily protein
MAHHTKDKGDLGVAKAHADLVAQGFMVLFPTTEHAAFDVVAYRDATFVRVQVKYRSAKLGVIKVEMKSTWSDTHGVHKRPIDKSQVDVVCVYCPDTDECYYFDPSAYGRDVSLRLAATRNNQAARINVASTLRLVPDVGVAARDPRGSREQLSLLTDQAAEQST